MRLYVMRHGPAEDRAQSGLDADRRLTAQGRARVERVALELRRVRGGAPLARVLASPLARARETAEIAAPLCGAPEVELQDDLAVDADLPLALVAALAREGADALLVGHQPNVEHLVRTLVEPSGRGAPRLLLSSFTTALIVALEREPAPPPQGRWRVARIVDPRALA